jgi:hypothetical protein
MLPVGNRDYKRRFCSANCAHPEIRSKQFWQKEALNQVTSSGGDVSSSSINGLLRRQFTKKDIKGIALLGDSQFVKVERGR